ncbi:MAG: FAD-dependent oxidoreductase [Anaerolineaceae bacterium]|nr:FAD-dependent oxidoreductase [Anaerolineaceae bacterium]MDE0328772.1 FAD-dependent oxidoreductase [Anaerolineaceae bacterium]
MSVSFWQADGEQPVREVDFLIIGAGLVGCAAALFAANAGRQVTITDARDLGLGASSRNAGFMITGLDSYYHRALERYGPAVVREMWGLSETTHRHLHHVIDAADGAVQRQRCGSLLLAESEDEARDLEMAARAMDADGIEQQFHARDPLRRGFHAAIEQARDEAIQPYELVQALFQQSGAELLPGNEVWRIGNGCGGRVRVFSRLAILEARYVLVCTNGWSATLLPQLARHMGPVRGQALVTAPLRQGPLLGTCGYSDYGNMYYRDTFDGRLLLGGGRRQNRWLEHNRLDERISDPVQRTLEAWLHRRFPDVDAPVERRWAGVMGFTSDGLPLVGRLPGVDNAGFAVGFNGHGLSLGAGTAERAVDLLLHDRHPGAVSAERLL